MSNGSDSSHPPQIPTPPGSLRGRDIGAADPPKSHADDPRPADATAAPYRLSGQTAASRSAGDAAATRAAESGLRTSAVRLTPKKTFAPAARADLPHGTETVEPTDLIEVEFEHGERLWVRGDDFRLNFAQTVIGRDATGAEQVEVPASLPVASRGMETRGPVAWTIKALKVFGVDLAGASARAIADSVDRPAAPSFKRQLPGKLYRCSTQPGKFDLQAVDITGDASDKPWLLFVHGTLSSTWGSFGELWSDKRAAELTALRNAYGDRIIAFEHATLTESPIKNASDLAAQLPSSARVHLVSHSRGGLIGELLCRAAVVAGDGAADAAAAPHPLPAFSDEELSAFAASADGDTPERQGQVALLRQLRTQLESKQIVVERFVRVACPVLGTTLASGRLDRWLSVIGTVTGAALPGTPLFDVFSDIGDFVAAIVKQRTDPATLPGLEAQMPDSPLIRLVNWPDVRVRGNLTVIAGDIDPSALWARLLIWLSDRFYEGDHDLVVNTPSMWGGARRSGLELVSSHKGPSVNHFSYFSEADSAARLVAALTAAGTPAGFEPLRKPTKPIARAVSERSSTASRPVVFVLPGIMGSELADENGSVWVALRSLLRGGLARLDIGAQSIQPTTPIARYYSDIVEHLGTTHTVIPFAFDWRVKITHEADRLAAAVRQQLETAHRQKQPIRFLAHSMGGLVVRTMIARHDALWRQICEHDGARLVMLGTPNGGSHAITELLVGRSTLLRKLARLDIRSSRQELLAIIARFPGVLAMLPAARSDDDFFAETTWSTYHARGGDDGWTPPARADLADAAELRRVLDTSPFDPQRMVYVAGSADVTIAGMRLAFDAWRQRDRIEFVATTRGDGRVTWEHGIPPSVPTYYMDVEHGDLASYAPAFPAIQELLSQGTTRLLEQTPPVSRGIADLFPLPPAEDDQFPDEDDLKATAIGAGSRKNRTRVRRERPLQVRVVHGNLAFSRDVIAVGHYAGDAIVSAERHLDRVLDGALSRRHQMGLYPGPVETNAVFTNPRCVDPRFLGLKGALVVGLGPVGSLTASQLTRSFTRALLEYALESSRQPRPSPGDKRELGISALLIGTGAGGITVADSVYALIRGAMRANEMLATTKQQERISTLEFIELWEDRAIQAVESLHMLSTQPGIRDLFALEPTLNTRDGGLRRLSYDEPPDWWQRLQILGGARDGQPADGGLRFAALTGRARTEVRLLSTQRQLVDQFIEGAIAHTRDDRGVARTLFDLLLPNDLKESAPDEDNVVLLLDEESARYPWELLEDASGDGRRPWVVEHGLLRQLEAAEFRHTVHAAADNTALIIGDPVSRFVELKGAQAEAEAVWKTLQRGFVAEKRVRPNSQEVVSALFARPYKVLHLAGHGVYRYVPPEAQSCDACGQTLVDARAARQRGTPQAITGMVIGDGVFLTPAEVQQMRRVPELVFINCCYLGRIEATPTGGPDGERRAFPQLAANVATEFIRMGVRAVVAAGWAVDDAAAATFSTVFYDELLKGETFGTAVKVARTATYDSHPGSNTWGAYQCYGDPEYRLIMPSNPSRAGGGHIRIVSPAHAVQDLGNVAARLKTGATSDREWELERIQRIQKAIEDKGWMKKGAVVTALGRAYAEAGRLEEAARFFREALSAEDAAITAKDIEQLANVEARHALARWKKAAALDEEQQTALRQDCAGQIRRSLTILETLTGQSLGATAEPFGKTAERLSLIGSAYKRLALIERGEQRLAALEQMAAFYRKAAELAAVQRGDTGYPLLNAAAAAIALKWQRPAPADAEGDDGFLTRLSEDISAARGAIAEALSTAPTFWQYAMSVDAELLDALGSRALEEADIERIARSYLDYRGIASEHEFGSVFTQIEFLLSMALDEQLRAHMEDLRDRIQRGAQS